MRAEGGVRGPLALPVLREEPPLRWPVSEYALGRSDSYAYLLFPGPLLEPSPEQPPSLHFPQGASVPGRVPKAGALPWGWGGRAAGQAARPG